MLNLQISKVENGYIVIVDRDPNHFDRCEGRFVFITWEAAVGFLSSLNERLK